jgi:DmsE family decaheme c-type cytochrome
MQRNYFLTRRLAGLIACCLLVPVDANTEEDPPYSRDGADSCIACHDDGETLALFRGKHAVPTDERGPFGHGQLQCEACHGPGGLHAGRVRRGEERPALIRFGSGAPTGVSVQNSMCLDCHTPDVGFGWHAGSHDMHDIACADCHTSHRGSDPVLQTSTQPEVCFHCHKLQRSETLKAFSHPLYEQKMACSDCHSPHGDTADLQFARQTVNDTCFQCHAEKRGPHLWEHQPVTEDCTLCHTPHGSSHPGMLTRRAPLLCQSCHSQPGHPSLVHDADGIATEMPSQFLLGQSCMNCHTQVHGSNHPSGSKLMR